MRASSRLSAIGDLIGRAAREAVKGEIPPLGRALEPGICFIASFRQKAGPAFTPGLRLADEAFRADGAA